MTRYKPEGDKIMRLHAQTATIENGFVHLPREAHWLADYLHELVTFPQAATTIRSTRPPRPSPGSCKNSRLPGSSNMPG